MVGIGIMEAPGAAIQNIASVAGTATTGLHASIHTHMNNGRVDGAFFDKMSAEWREEQNRCLREIETTDTI